MSAASGASGDEWGKWGERAGEVLLGMGQCSQPPRTQAQLTGALRDERTTVWGHLYCKLYALIKLYLEPNRREPSRREPTPREPTPCKPSPRVDASHASGADVTRVSSRGARAPRAPRCELGANARASRADASRVELAASRAWLVKQDTVVYIYARATIHEHVAQWCANS